MIMTCTSVVSHIAFHSHSCHSSAAIRNLTSLLCNKPQAPKSLSIYARLCVCVCVCVPVCVKCMQVCVSLRQIVNILFLTKEHWHCNFFLRVRLLCAHMYMCVPMSAKCHLQGSFFSSLSPLPPPLGTPFIFP